MKKFILAALMVLGVASTANAQSIGFSDLFGKSYATVSAGRVYDNTDRRVNYGVAFGREFASLLRGEVAYDYYDSDKHTRKGYGQTLVANGIVQYQVPGTIFTPYLLAGAGYGWKTFGDEYIYNFGGGVRAELTKNIDVDLRAKRTSNLHFGDHNNVKFHNDAVTAGVSYKF